MCLLALVCSVLCGEHTFNLSSFCLLATRGLSLSLSSTPLQLSSAHVSILLTRTDPSQNIDIFFPSFSLGAQEKRSRSVQTSMMDLPPIVRTSSWFLVLSLSLSYSSPSLLFLHPSCGLRISNTSIQDQWTTRFTNSSPSYPHVVSDVIRLYARSKC